MSDQGINRFRLLLIGNYRLDRQMSMLRYHDMLFDALRERGVAVNSIEPATICGHLPADPLTKWLRYVDKYLFFPFQLRARIRKERRQLPEGHVLLLHISDHSNSPYASIAPAEKWMATCHDLLAVRGALGEDTDCPASGFGKILQRKIVAGLAKCRHIICVSSATQGDLARIVPGVPSEVIPLPLNQPYSVLPANLVEERLREYCPALLEERYVLHVGSSLRRKNREGILRSFAQIAPQWSGRLVFAGESLPPELRQLSTELGLADRVTELANPPAPIIEALYNRAHCLFFPSKTEGFGWPIIEAQACGCPVIIARTTSLPEVAGQGALIRDFNDEKGFAEDILRLDDPPFRNDLIVKGLENLRRFEISGIMDRYLSTYKKLAE